MVVVCLSGEIENTEGNVRDSYRFSPADEFPITPVRRVPSNERLGPDFFPSSSTSRRLIYLFSIFLLLFSSLFRERLIVRTHTHTLTKATPTTTTSFRRCHRE